MIINSQMVSDLIMATTTTKQEPNDDDEMKPLYTNDTLQLNQTNEDCNNNLNNMSNKNLKLESKTMFNNSSNTFQSEIGTRCTGCQHIIEDKYVFNLMNTYWHEECLQCSQCRISLKKTCFFKNGLIYCKDDYFKQFGTRCNACFELILTNELVMRFLVNNNPTNDKASPQLLNYHLNCFKCIACERHLQKGDEFVLKSEGIFCKHDYEHSFQASHSTLLNRLNSTTSSLKPYSTPQFDELTETQTKQKQPTPRKSSSSRRITKRPRTILNAVQRYDFREAFKQSPKPCRKVREHLASKTGLSVRVVQVWFQNERAKMKKMQRRQQQNMLSQKLTKKGTKSNSKKGNTNKKSMSKRKTIDSDSMISEENSLAGEDDEYGEEDDEDESENSSDEEFDESDDEIEDEEDDEELTKLNRLNSNLTSNNTSSSSSVSSTSSLSEFNNSFLPQQHQIQQQYSNQIQQQQQTQHYFHQHNQQPIDRLYSMQNAYFV